MIEYMEMPQETKFVAEAFVKHGEANGGEDGFAIEELSELIRAICRIQRYGEKLGGTNMPKYNLTEEEVSDGLYGLKPEFRNYTTEVWGR